jgi:DNA-binding helix-hairpin-helix protein with protein kinase domain
MAQFYDSQGESLTLGKELGRGGEGSVFIVRERADSVAKIYHEPVSVEKAEKLRQMVRLKTDKLLRLATWVTDVLHNEAGETVGFLMPRLSSNAQIHELYNPASRRRRFPEADWRFLIHAAANIARAFGVIHAHGHVVGDVNHGNIVIARDATVRLIDCDSYHLNAPEQSFLCEVGVSTHTPPELQGKSLREIPRTSNHDNFGLAVLIFQLLFMGRHPFSGRFLGAGENTLENSIRQQKFAYGDDAPQREMQRPPGTLPLAAASAPIAELFRRAFLEIENRPTTREWTAALENLEQNLRECGFNTAHYFHRDWGKCPWCELEAETGVLFFPAHFNENFVADPNVDLVTVGRLIDIIKPPDVPTELPAKMTSNTVPSPVINESLSKFNRNLAIYLAGLGLTIILLIAFVGSGIFTIGIIIFYICSAVIKSLMRTAQTEAEALFDSAKYNLEKFQNEWKKVAGKNIFTDARTELKNSVAEFKNLPTTRAAKLSELRNHKLALQTKHLFEERIEAEFEERRLQLEAEIKDGLPRLQRLSLEISNNYQNLLSKSEQVDLEFVSAERDVERVSELKAKAVGWTIGVVCASLLVAVPVRQIMQSNDGGNKLNNRSNATADKIHPVLNSEKVKAPPPVFVTDNFYLEDGTRITPETWGKAFDLYQEGIQFNTVGEYDKAAKSFQKAINLKQEVSELRVRLGESFYFAGKHGLAVAAFNDALKINPNSSQAHHMLGESYNKLLRRTDAIKSFKNAVDANPNAALSFYELGATLRADKKPNEAINYLNDALRILPELNDARFELALCYDEVGFRDLALKEHNKLELNAPVPAKELAGRLGIKNGY